MSSSFVQHPEQFSDNSADQTAAVQAAITDGNYVFLSGSTYTIAGNLSIPGRRKIIVERGAVINTTGRFTARNVNDVEWQIDGIINVTAMPTAPAVPEWPNTAAGTQLGDERGFLEFGGADTNTPQSGFYVHGRGKIVGPWTGTPNFNDSEHQVNRKGIAVWHSRNVRIEGIEISGFEGEQVYVRVSRPECTDITLSKIYSHDCRFNALNFNVAAIDTAGAYKGLWIVDCVTGNSFAGIEASGGVISRNYCGGATNYGIWFGLGSGRGPIEVSHNTVEDCTGAAYVLSFSSSAPVPVYDVHVLHNRAITTGGTAFAFNKLAAFMVVGNTSRGHARQAPGMAFSFTNCIQGWADQNITFDPGEYSTGNFITSNSLMELGRNPIVSYTSNAVSVNGAHIGFGGNYAAQTSYGNRENQFVAWSANFNTTGTGAEYVFKNGSVGNTVYASIAGSGQAYNENGSTGGVVIATNKESTSQALPDATAVFDGSGNTHLYGHLTVHDTSLARSGVTLINGAGAAIGSLGNAPSAGNPSKWLAVFDNGVWRYVPSWEF